MCPLMEERKYGKIVHGFLQNPPVSFSLADPVVYSLAVINLSHDCIYMLCSLSPSKESSNIRVLGYPKTFLRNKSTGIM